jgi:O-antigen ligase
VKRGETAGWRMHRGAATMPTHGSITPTAAFVPRLPSPVPDETWTVGQMWSRTRWSLLFVALLAYILVATTQRIPVGDVAVAAAIFGLALEGRVRMPRFLGWFAAYTVWCAFTLLVTGRIGIAGQDLLDLAKVWIITLLVTSALATRPRQQIFILFWAFWFAFYPARGAILNYLAGYTLFGRAIWNGIYQNPNDLAALTLLQLSMVASILAGGARGWARRAAIAGVVVLPLIVLLTQSRGALIALTVFLVAAFARQRHLIKARHAVALLCLGGVLVALAPKGVWDRLGGLRHIGDEQGIENMDAEGSARGRWAIWKVAVRIIGGSPVYGVGYGTYHVTHAQLAFKLGVDRAAQGERDTHSTPLKVSAETGLVGLVLFATLLISAVLFAERVRRQVRHAMPAAARQLLFLELGILGFHVAGIWGSYADISFTYLHLGLVWCFAESCRQQFAAAYVASPLGATAVRRS